MKTRLFNDDENDQHYDDENLLHLALPGLLPASSILVINPGLCVVSLLCLDSDQPGIRKQVPVTASGMAVLIPLLQSYPGYCSYAALLSHLFPRLSREQWRMRLDQAHGDEREALLRPLRRPIGTLSDDLRQLGLEVCSLRAIGYLLKQAPSYAAVHS